jgi:hypothetical protein
MSTAAALSVFIPAEALVLLLVTLGGLALIVGARRLAGVLLGLAVAVAVLPPLIEPLLNEAPVWLLVVLLAWLAIALLRAFLVVFIGGRAADNAIGVFVGALLTGLCWLPILLLRGCVSLLGSLLRRMLG